MERDGDGVCPGCNAEGNNMLSVKSVQKMAKIVRGQDREFLSGSQEERNAGIVYGTTTGRYKSQFLHSSLPRFLRSPASLVVRPPSLVPVTPR